MFHTIYPAISDRMTFLEELDAKDRLDGTARLQRLRQIPPETGKFLALLAAEAPEGPILEIGTSAGYSTLWLTVAVRALGRKIVTFEVLPEKVKLAEETFRLAGVENTVKLIAGEAREHLTHYDRIAFAFLDAEKEVYGGAGHALASAEIPATGRVLIVLDGQRLIRERAKLPTDPLERPLIPNARESLLSDGAEEEDLPLADEPRPLGDDSRLLRAEAFPPPTQGERPDRGVHDHAHRGLRRSAL